MREVKRRFFLLAMLVFPAFASAQVCSVSQITDDDSVSRVLTRPSISGDGQSISLGLAGDPVGFNPDGNYELFRWQAGSGMTQLTQTTNSYSLESYNSRDGRRIAFESDADLTGGNPDLNVEGFLWDEAIGFIQLTNTDNGFFLTKHISGDGKRVFVSTGADPLLGPNTDGEPETFLWEDGSLTRLTDGAEFSAGVCSNYDGSISGIASNSDLVPGGNPGNVVQIFEWRENVISQLTTGAARSTTCGLSATGNTMAILSEDNLDPAVGNPAGTSEAFLLQNGVFRQVTQGADVTPLTLDISADGKVVFFGSQSDPVGMNPDGSSEYFAWSELTGTVQLTQLPAGATFIWAQADDRGRFITFTAAADLTGDNPDGSEEVFIADCGAVLSQAIPTPVPSIGIRQWSGLAMILGLFLVGLAGLRRRES